MKQHNYNRENPPNKYNPLAVIGEDVEIGDNCWIGPFVMIQGNVKIGDEVSLSSGVKIYDHDTSEYRVTEGERTEEHYKITIGKFTQIGSNTVIVPRGNDIHIGDHVIIGANSVICANVGHHSKVGPLSYVNHPIKSWYHVVGAPAMMKRDITHEFYKGKKTMTKKSYLLIGDRRGRDIANNTNDGTVIDRPNLSGLYLWQQAFNEHGSKGVINNVWDIDELEKYDIVHINYTPSNIQLPSIIKDELVKFKNTSTKLVINVDLDVSKWGASWSYQYHNLFREVCLADHIFHVESVGAKILSDAINKPVTTLPHPVDVSRLYDMISIEREPIIATIYHRYNAETMIPYLAQKDCGFARVLYGYTPGKHQYVANAGMYHEVRRYTTFQDHIENLSIAGIGCDLYDGLTYGRSVVEFGALAIPAVVSNTIEASIRIYPYTSIDPYSVVEARELFTKLITDEEFANDLVIPTANQGLPYYGLKQRYEKFVEMIEGNK